MPVLNPEKYLFLLILQVLYHGIKSTINSREKLKKNFFPVYPGTKSPFLGGEFTYGLWQKFDVFFADDGQHFGIKYNFNN